MARQPQRELSKRETSSLGTRRDHRRIIPGPGQLPPGGSAKGAVETREPGARVAERAFLLAEASAESMV